MNSVLFYSLETSGLIILSFTNRSDNYLPPHSVVKANLLGKEIDGMSDVYFLSLGKSSVVVVFSLGL